MDRMHLLLFLYASTFLISLIPPVSPGGHTYVWAPVKLSIPFNGLIGLAALKVSQLSLATALLAKGKLKFLKTARKKISKKTVHPIPPRKYLPPSFFPVPPVPGFNPWAPYFPPVNGHLGSASFHHPGVIIPSHRFGPIHPGFPRFGPFGPTLPFGPPRPVGFGYPPYPPVFPPPFIPHKRKTPEFLKTKLVDPKDACILKMVCEFEFHPNKLGGGQLEKLLLGISSPLGKNTIFRRRRDGDSKFWINIKRIPHDEKVGTEICENRYPSCNFSPIFKFNKRSGDTEPTISNKIPLNNRVQKFISDVEERIGEWTAKLKAL